MSGLYPCMHTSKEKLGITDYTFGFGTTQLCLYALINWGVHVIIKTKGEENNRVKWGIVKVQKVRKLGYQRSEVGVCQDVAIVCDGKCIAVDPELQTPNTQGRNFKKRRLM